MKIVNTTIRAVAEIVYSEKKNRYKKGEWTFVSNQTSSDQSLIRLPTYLDIIINILLPVLAGTGIYLDFFNKNETGIWRNQMPDGLWAYSSVSTFLIIWNRQINWFWISAFMLVCIILEYLQYLHWIEGTGDLWDLLIFFVCSSLALITNKYYFIIKNKLL